MRIKWTELCVICGQASRIQAVAVQMCGELRKIRTDILDRVRQGLKRQAATTGHHFDQMIALPRHLLVAPDQQPCLGHSLRQIGDHMWPTPWLTHDTFAEITRRQRPITQELKRQHRTPPRLVAADRKAEGQGVALQPLGKPRNPRSRAGVERRITNHRVHSTENILVADEQGAGTSLLCASGLGCDAAAGAVHLPWQDRFAWPQKPVTQARAGAFGAPISHVPLRQHRPLRTHHTL